MDIVIYDVHKLYNIYCEVFVTTDNKNRVL